MEADARAQDQAPRARRPRDARRPSEAVGGPSARIDKARVVETRQRRPLETADVDGRLGRLAEGDDERIVDRVANDAKAGDAEARARPIRNLYRPDRLQTARDRRGSALGHPHLGERLAKSEISVEAHGSEEIVTWAK